MSYKVTRTGNNYPTTSKWYMTLAQATHGARKFAYEQLAAHGKLDTIAAHETMRQINDTHDILEARISDRARTILISNTGYSLTITRE